MNSNATKTNYEKAWNGRFANPNSPLMETFNCSIAVDYRLWQADLACNRAWAAGLQKIGVLTAPELQLIQTGLDTIQQEFENQRFQIIATDEDIHLAIERRLTELIGDTGARIHTGRSRNDQVVTDFRWYLKRELPGLRLNLKNLMQALVQQAENHISLIMPGYTHLQPAQPILYAHYLLALYFMLARDLHRISDYEERLNILPLGAGALAGSAFPIDREFLAWELDFKAVSENSIDAVSDRDFVLELVSILTIIQLHLSRYAEDFIIWSSQEFNFIELDDAWTTGSSMMPQKKNPDSLELIRGKSARLIGLQSGLFSLLKGLPLTYAKDLQEDKAATFEALDTVQQSVLVFTGVIQSLKINSEQIQTRLDSALFATDLADYLVKKGVPFRQSHKIVGQLVRWGIEHHCPLPAIPLAVYQEFSAVFAEDVQSVFDWQQSIARRDLAGGTGPNSVRQQIQAAKKL
ncbi:argininosuccinate lyase [candidate division KSB1 bacterium]|nr:argininosuccinate lyase [candidate division KSB1 bacterium]